MRTVLLGAAGTGTAFALASRIRAVWGADVRIVAVDINPAELVTTSLLADSFVQVPLVNDPAYEKCIRELIEAEQVNTFIPILNDEHVVAVNLLSDPALAKLDVWSSELYARCTDKRVADDWLSEIGVPTPMKPDLTEASRGGEWFVKPVNGVGSRGARRISAEELHGYDQTTRETLIVQEVCKEPEVTVDSFHDDRTGASFVYCRERLETKAGVCTKARVFFDPELAAIAKKIARGLRQRGTLCFQVMKGLKGWVVTDLNLRSGAGTAITCSAGFDVLAAAFACRAGEDYTKFLSPIAAGEEFIVTRQYAEFVMQHRT